MDTKQLLKLLELALDDYRLFNDDIDIDKLYDISIVKGTNKRIKNIGGTYNHRKRLITINVHVLIAKRGELNYKLIDNVVRHELAHHIDYIKRGISKHDSYFKDICDELNMVDSSAYTIYNGRLFDYLPKEEKHYKELLDAN